MTVHSVYIGELDDPEFSWDGGDRNNNVPKAITPTFPNARTQFSRVLEAIREQRFVGKQTDFGGWVAKVTKEDILKLLEEWYPVERYNPHTQNSFEKVDYEQLLKVKEAIPKLDDKRIYALVAWEC